MNFGFSSTNICVDITVEQDKNATVQFDEIKKVITQNFTKLFVNEHVHAKTIDPVNFKEIEVWPIRCQLITICFYFSLYSSVYKCNQNAFLNNYMHFCNGIEISIKLLSVGILNAFKCS